jgi:hypothetical protein
MNYYELIKIPRKFFKSVEEETLSTTLKRIALPLIIFIAAYTYLTNHTFAFLYGLMGQQPTFTINQLLTSIILVAVSIFIGVLLLQLSLKILKVKSKFQQTLKTIIYPTILLTALMILIQLVSLITPVLLARFIIQAITSIALLIWSVILVIIGLTEFYKISTGKAIGAYALSIALGIVIYIVFTIIGAITLLK